MLAPDTLRLTAALVLASARACRVAELLESVAVDQ